VLTLLTSSLIVRSTGVVGGAGVGGMVGGIGVMGVVGILPPVLAWGLLLLQPRDRSKAACGGHNHIWFSGTSYE